MKEILLFLRRRKQLEINVHFMIPNTVGTAEIYGDCKENSCHEELRMQTNG